jgi:ribosomal small subunit protein bTHX
MGKGDKRSRKGKIRTGSYGKSRPHKDRNARKQPPTSQKRTPADRTRR